MLTKAITFLLLAVATLPVTGCLLRTHEVKRTVKADLPLQAATRDQLVEKINAEAAKVKTYNATVDIATEVGGERKGKVTEYQEIRGYVLLRKPELLRLIGLFPVVRNRAFDMVSDGEHFKLSIPSRNKFIIGSKEVTKPSKNGLENLRPQHILDAILVREIDAKTEIAVLESATETVVDTKTKKMYDEPSYTLDVLKLEDGKWYLGRKILFSRRDLLPRKQLVYDRSGNIATIATYDNFADFNGVMLPNVTRVERPQEEYSISLGVVKLKLNEPLTDQQFQLAQPAGAQVIYLDNTQPAQPAAANTEPKGRGHQR